MTNEARPPLPPFTHETALVKVQKGGSGGRASFGMLLDLLFARAQKALSYVE